jgi:pimeloyl-ACP methyl ester carboxylesterase
VSGYAIDLLVGDVLAVADAAGAGAFMLWGFSYGANIGRYVAARSGRVTAMLYVGIPFGAAASPAFRTVIQDLHRKWTPVVEADRAGKVDRTSLSAEDRARLDDTPALIARHDAMLDYPPVEPSDMPCPTLWLVGEANEAAMESVSHYQSEFAGTMVTATILPGFSHAQELRTPDVVLPLAKAFLHGHTA